jgi:hypothetical protein
MAKITITSSDKKQLEFIKRVREYIEIRTPEQLAKVPKDKNGLIDFATIFERQDKIVEGMKGFKDKLDVYNLGDTSIQDFMDEIIADKELYSNNKKSTLDLLNFKKHIDEKFN